MRTVFAFLMAGAIVAPGCAAHAQRPVTSYEAAPAAVTVDLTGIDLDEEASRGILASRFLYQIRGMCGRAAAMNKMSAATGRPRGDHKRCVHAVTVDSEDLRIKAALAVAKSKAD